MGAVAVVAWLQDDKDMSVIVTALKMKLAPFGWTEQVKRDQKQYTISKVGAPWQPTDWTIFDSNVSITARIRTSACSLHARVKCPNSSCLACQPAAHSTARGSTA